MYQTLASDWAEEKNRLIRARMNIQEILVSLSALLQRYERSMYLLNHEYTDIFNQIWRAGNCSELMDYCEVLLEAVTDYMDTARNAGKESVIGQIKKYLEIHYAESISLNDTAAKYYMNAAYLSRAFKKETGVNFNDYVKQIRMERAAEFLTGTDMKVYEIARRVGYENESYFMKKFRETLGMTPGQFKDQEK